MSRWKEYLKFLDGSPYSVHLLTSNLAPQSPISGREDVEIRSLNYKLWPFQERILREMSPSTLILGLPTGLGKTYIAGAKLKRDSEERPIRVLFLVPSIPLGVQQALFAREKLNVGALFVSGEIPPQDREELGVWNNGFVVTTPQTFYNDNLTAYEAYLQEARKLDDPIEYLSGLIEDFPYDVVVADECQRYIGNTDGYSTLLTARACGSSILALSATPQLHAPERLKELRKVFDEIRVFSVEDPGIKEHMPPRLVVMERVKTPEKLLRVYHALGGLSRSYHYRVRKKYGRGHKRNCTEHNLCRALLAVKLLRFRMVEDGASSVIHYKAWRFKDLKNKRKSLDGESVYQAYQEALDEVFNHKIFAAMRILRQPGDKKLAKTFALVSMRTHEKRRLLSVKRRVEETYGFTQRLQTRTSRPLRRGQRTIAEFMD